MNMADWELGLPVASWYHKRTSVPHIASAGKDQNSKSEVQFLLSVYSCCITLKSKNL